MTYLEIDYQVEYVEDVEHNTQLCLTRIRDLEGLALSVDEKLFVSQSLIIGGDLYDGRKPDVRQGGGYMGNQCAEIEQFYKDSVSNQQYLASFWPLLIIVQVLLILPSEHIVSFLLGGDASHVELENLMAILRPRATAWADTLLPFCRQVLDESSVPSDRHDLDLGSVAATAVRLGNTSLFAEAVDKTVDSFSPDTYRDLGANMALEDTPIAKDV